jgi:putative transposase
VKYGFIQEQEKTYPVAVLCRVMQVSTSAYYAWVRRPEDTDNSVKRKQLEQQAEKIFAESKHSYGSRRLSDALKKADFSVGRYKARRIMAALNLEARYPAI